MEMRATYGVRAVVMALLPVLLLATCQKSSAPREEKSAPQQATEPARKPVSRAVITFLSGDVMMKTADDWQPAEIGMGLPKAATVKTGADSLCDLQMGSKAVVRIGENTVLSLDTLSLESQKAQVGLNLMAGTVVCKVNALTDNERFQVRTTSAVCGVRGTEFVVNITNQKQVLLGVQKGEVTVAPPWADLLELRAELKENGDVLAPLEDQVNETARVVTANQQVTVKTETVQAWEKTFAPIQEKINALSARARAGEVITREAVKEISESLEPLESSLAHPLEASKPLATTTTAVLAQTASMRFREIPEAEPGQDSTSAAPTPTTLNLVTVTVTTQPADAEILLNGSVAGMGTCSGLFAPGEKATFLARRAGYASKTLEVTVEKGATRTYSLELEKEAAPRPAPAEKEKVSTVPAEIKPLVRRFSLAGKPLVSRIAVSGEKVFAADAAGTLFAASVNGKMAWSLATQNTPNETSAPLLLGSRLYFTGASEFVIVEAATGKVSHRCDLDDSSSCQFGQKVAELESDGVFPTAGGVRLFDLGTGAMTQEISVPGGSMMTPAVWNGKIVTVSQEGELFVIDPATKSVVSRVPTRALQPVAVSVQVRGDRGYFADRKGLVVCVDLAGAKVLWQASLIAKGSAGVFNDMECGAEGLFAFGKGTLYGLSLSQGEPLFSPITGITCPPLYHDGKLYFGTDQGALHVAEAATGRILGAYETTTRISTRPEWSDGLLYLGTASGEIIVLNPRGVKRTDL